MHYGPGPLIISALLRRHALHYDERNTSATWHLTQLLGVPESGTAPISVRPTPTP